jgi:hypothetical protein
VYVKVYCKVEGKLRCYSVDTANHEAARAAVQYAEGPPAKLILAVIQGGKKNEGIGVA